MIVRLVSILAFGVFVACFSGCASAPVPLRASERLARAEPIWVVSNRFHSSLAVRAEDAPPEMRRFDPHARYFVLGWGGSKLYMLRDVKPWEWITCLIFPTPSALHVIPIRTSLAQGCRNSHVIEFRTTRSGRERLRKYLHQSFARDNAGEIIFVGPGKLQASRFFAGTETYFLPKTCNTWVAAALKSAEVPICVLPAWAADNLLWQGAKHGRVINHFRRPADKL